MRSPGREGAIYESEIGPTADTKQMGAFISDFPTTVAMKTNTFLLFTNCRDYGGFCCSISGRPRYLSNSVSRCQAADTGTSTSLSFHWLQASMELLCVTGQASSYLLCGPCCKLWTSALPLGSQRWPESLCSGEANPLHSGAFSLLWSQTPP